MKKTSSFTSLLTKCLLKPHQNLSVNPEDTDQTQSLLLLLYKLHQSLNFYKARLSLVVACTNTHKNLQWGSLDPTQVKTCFHSIVKQSMTWGIWEQADITHTMLIAGWESKQRGGCVDSSQNSVNHVSKKGTEDTVSDPTRIKRATQELKSNI